MLMTSRIIFEAISTARRMLARFRSSGKKKVFSYIVVYFPNEVRSCLLNRLAHKTKEKNWSNVDRWVPANNKNRNKSSLKYCSHQPNDMQKKKKLLSSAAIVLTVALKLNIQHNCFKHYSYWSLVQPTKWPRVAELRKNPRQWKLLSAFSICKSLIQLNGIVARSHKKYSALEKKCRFAIHIISLYMKLVKLDLWLWLVEWLTQFAA